MSFVSRLDAKLSRRSPVPQDPEQKEEVVEQSRPDWYKDEYDDTMWLHVSVREAKFIIPCCTGVQDFAWLGSIVARQYAARHPETDPESYHCVHIMDQNEMPLFPSSIIGQECAAGAAVEVELIGPKIGLNDPTFTRHKTLWELYCYTPKHDYVTVEFAFDSTAYEPLDREVPGVFGNFNNWGLPILMHKDHTKGARSWRHQMRFPAQAQIVFKFIVRGEPVLVNNYSYVRDVDGNKLNYFQVELLPCNYHELQVTEPDTMELDEPFPAEDEIVEMNIKLPKRIIGRFQAVPSLTEELKRKQFDMDWEKVQIVDAIRLKQARDKCKDALWRFADPLRRIFRYYSSQGGSDIAYMNILKWVHFCHICKIPDKNKVTVSTLDAIFHRVNIEEIFDEEKISENPQSYRYAMTLKEDPFNPDNQFIRGEFYEALLRVALFKNPNLSPVDAFIKLMQNHVLPYALDAATDSLRDELLSPDCQRIYSIYSPRLYKLFKHYAQEDSTDTKINASSTINLREYDMMLHHFGLYDKRVSRRLALSAFALSKEDEVVDDQDFMYAMIYPEFLEVLARLADARYGMKQKDGQNRFEKGHYMKNRNVTDKYHANEMAPLYRKLEYLFDYMFPKDKRAQEALLQQREEILQKEAEEVRAQQQAILDAEAAKLKKAKKKKKKKTIAPEQKDDKKSGRRK